MAESFFGTLKADLMQERDFETRIEAIVAITEYVESFYNPQLRHSSLGYVSPLMFELQHAGARIEA